MAPIVLGWRVYPFAIALAVLAGVVATLISARRERVPLRPLFALQGLLLIATFAGAKLFWLAEVGALTRPWSVPFTVDGLRYPGGMAALLIALPLLARRFGLSLPRLGDVVAPAIAVAMAVVRVGCLLQGCCFGTVSTLPWAVEFPLRSKAWTEHVSAGLIERTTLHSLAVHPLQIYFGLWSLLVALWLFRRQRRPHRAGDLLLLFLVLHEGGKGVLETLRVPPHPELQLVSLAAALLGMIAWLWRRQSHDLPATGPVHSAG